VKNGRPKKSGMQRPAFKGGGKGKTGWVATLTRSGIMNGKGKGKTKTKDGNTSRPELE